MDNCLKLSLDFDIYTESLPEGEFHVVKILLDDGHVYGKHRGGANIAVALAFENLAKYIKQQYYKDKASGT